mmetsp:Transcript_13116/g.28506  ORF Transcript_13116/g.28506 Transcript_13116/m.28506 type:complete len:379 (-) Transcript_13116:24-1160(-)
MFPDTWILTDRPITRTWNITEDTVKHALLVSSLRRFFIQDWEELSIARCDKHGRTVHTTQLIHKHVSSFRISIIRHNISRRLQLILLALFSRMTCQPTHNFQQLTSLAAGRGTHVQYAHALLGVKYDGRDHAHGFLTGNVSAIRLNFEPVMERLQGFIATESASIDRELVAEGCTVVADEGDGLGGCYDLFDDDETVVIAILVPVLFIFIITICHLDIRTFTFSLLCVIFCTICNISALLQNVLNSPKRRTPPGQFNLQFHLLPHKLLQFLQHLLLDIRIQRSIHTKGCRKNPFQCRHEKISLGMFLLVAYAGYKLLILYIVSSTVQAYQTVVRLEFGIGIFDNVVGPRTIGLAFLVGFRGLFLSLAFAAPIFPFAHD